MTVLALRNFLFFFTEKPAAFQSCFLVLAETKIVWAVVESIDGRGVDRGGGKCHSLTLVPLAAAGCFSCAFKQCVYRIGPVLHLFERFVYFTTA